MRLIDADKFLSKVDPDEYYHTNEIRDMVADTIAAGNAPLTLEQLREMDGEPVWCESEHRPDGSGWFIVDASALQPHEFIAIGRERGIPCAGIDTGYWLAYRHKPEAFGMQRLEVWVEEP